MELSIRQASRRRWHWRSEDHLRLVTTSWRDIETTERIAMATSPLNPHRRIDDFLAHLNSHQETALKLLKKWLDTPRAGLEWYYQIGAFVGRLRPGSPSTYRTGWIESLAREVGLSSDLLRKAHAFTRNYTLAETKKLDNRLTFYKVSLLISIEDKAKRLELQWLAIKEKWSYPQLRLEIQRRLGVRRPRAGRPSPRPKNYGYEVGLQQLIRMAEKWMLHHQQVWTGSSRSVIKRIEHLPPEKCTPELVEQLEEASARLKEMQGAVGDLQGVLGGLLGKVRSELAGREDR